MELSDLKPAEGSHRDRKRLGRGESSGQGKTAGKGHKGQMARSGANHRAWFEGGQMPLQRRLPTRGFTNIFKKKIVNVSLADLETRFESGDEVTVAALVEKGLVPGRKDEDGGWLLRKGLDGVKVLGDGELTRKLTVRVHAFSESAKSKIESAGGAAEALGFGKQPAK